MNMQELYQKIKAKGIYPDAISIGSGLPDANEQYCITENGKVWEVYYAERGQKGSLKTFPTESEACNYLLSILEEDTSVWSK